MCQNSGCDPYMPCLFLQQAHCKREGNSGNNTAVVVFVLIAIACLATSPYLSLSPQLKCPLPLLWKLVNITGDATFLFGRLYVPNTIMLVRRGMVPFKLILGLSMCSIAFACLVFCSRLAIFWQIKQAELWAKGRSKHQQPDQTSLDNFLQNPSQLLFCLQDVVQLAIQVYVLSATAVFDGIAAFALTSTLVDAMLFLNVAVVMSMSDTCMRSCLKHLVSMGSYLPFSNRSKRNAGLVKSAKDVVCPASGKEKDDDASVPEADVSGSLSTLHWQCAIQWLIGAQNTGAKLHDTQSRKVLLRAVAIAFCVLGVGVVLDKTVPGTQAPSSAMVVASMICMVVITAIFGAKAWLSLQWRTAHVMHPSPVGANPYSEHLPDGVRQNKERAKVFIWDKLMPAKYFWAHQTMATAALHMYVLLLMFLPVCRFMMMNVDRRDPWCLLRSSLMGSVATAMVWALWRCLRNGLSAFSRMAIKAPEGPASVEADGSKPLAPSWIACCLSIRKYTREFQENEVAAGGNALDYWIVGINSGQLYSLTAAAMAPRLPVLFRSITKHLEAVFMLDFARFLHIPGLDLAASESTQQIATAMLMIFCVVVVVWGMPAVVEADGEPREDTKRNSPSLAVRTSEKKRLVDKYRQARTTKTYDGHGSITNCATHFDLAMAKHSAFVTLTLAFQPQYWALPLVFLFEKAAMAAVGIFASPDGLLRVAYPCASMVFFLLLILSGRVYCSPVKLILALTSRISSLSVCAIGLVNYAHPGFVSDSVADALLISTLAVSIVIFLCVLNPVESIRKLHQYAKMTNRLLEVSQLYVPSESNATAPWTLTYSYNKYDTLVMSLSQIEHAICHCSEDIRFVAWLQYGALHRQALASITELQLVNCGIVGLGEGIGALKTLLSIDLSNNSALKKLPAAIGSLVGLRTLKATSCGLSGDLRPVCCAVLACCPLRCANAMLRWH